MVWALQTLVLAETFNTLPKVGGLDDQDAFQMTLLLETISLRAALMPKPGDKDAPRRT